MAMAWTAQGVTEDGKHRVEIRDTHTRDWTILIDGEPVEILEEVHYRDGGTKVLTLTGNRRLELRRKMNQPREDNLDGVKLVP